MSHRRGLDVTSQKNGEPQNLLLLSGYDEFSYVMEKFIKSMEFFITRLPLYFKPIKCSCLWTDCRTACKENLVFDPLHPCSGLTWERSSFGRSYEERQADCNSVYLANLEASDDECRMAAVSQTAVYHQKNGWIWESRIISCRRHTETTASDPLPDQQGK